jgi:hypothetical protein
MSARHGLLEMAGQRFGRWLVVERTGSTKTAYWLCRCDCGAERAVNGSSLRKGLSQSCGCLGRELSAQRRLKHGGKGSPEYRVWAGMKTRCLNPNDKHFKDYGGRGIKVCERWLSFEMFRHDMGPRPSAGHSIDRRDSDGDYEPGNCRWATSKEQTRNYSRNRLYAIGDVAKCLVEWCEEYGKRYHLVHARLRRGWPLERALA